jgi:glycolate oxidase FAD binding subunit
MSNATADDGLKLLDLAGPSAVRQPTSADAIDAVQPGIVVEPATAEAVAAVLAWARAEKRSVVIRGGGTKLDWGRPPRAIDVLLSTRGLNRIVRHEPGDLTVTAEAGVTVTALNQALGQHRQRLPIDVRSDAATIGGAVATNESGPLRHKYGPPGDQLIGIAFATTDGRLAKAGGNVVKNVAGYDLGKLLSGSFGTFAAIVSATFKLAPMPPDACTLLLEFPSGERVSGAAAAIAASQVEPLALEVSAQLGRSQGMAPRFGLLARFAGMKTANTDQIAMAGQLAAPFGPAHTETVANEADADLWRTYGNSLWSSDGAIIKLSWLPASLPRVLGALETLAASGDGAVDFEARAAAGVGAVVIGGTVARQTAAIAQLRTLPDVLPHVTLIRGDAALRGSVDVWQIPAASQPLLRSLKQTFDPAGILNASRGPI